MSGILHVIGAGLAGLSCAVAATRAGQRVIVHEATRHAGGRCRSFFCDRLGKVIDNGPHMVLGANPQALGFASAIGGRETLIPLDAKFPFMDITTGCAWVVMSGRLNAGLTETARALGLPWISTDHTVAAQLGNTPSFQKLWRPLCQAMLNTDADTASARIFAHLLRQLTAGGKRALRPHLASKGLSALFAAPAEATLAAHGARIVFEHRLRAIHNDRLEFDDGAIHMRAADRAVLAVPPWIAATLLPGLPDLATQAIVSAHFRLDHGAGLPGGIPFVGVVNGMAQWVFVRDDVASVVVSAANDLIEGESEDLARTLWQDIDGVLGRKPARRPPVRVVKERRATLAHTPEVSRLRPGPMTNVPWLWLAGDWLASPLPCTMESAIVSGLEAARMAMGRDVQSFA